MRIEQPTMSGGRAACPGGRSLERFEFFVRKECRGTYYLRRVDDGRGQTAHPSHTFTQPRAFVMHRTYWHQTKLTTTLELWRRKELRERRHRDTKRPTQTDRQEAEAVHIYVASRHASTPRWHTFPAVVISNWLEETAFNLVSRRMSGTTWPDQGTRSISLCRII